MRALYHVLLAGAGGGLLGALDAAVGQPPLDARSLALSAWLGFGSLAVLAMPVGFLQALVLHAWQRVAAKTAARQWDVLFGSAGTELRRRRVVQAHAIVVVSGVLLVVVLVGTFVGDSFFGTIQIASLRRLLLLGTVAAVVSGAALAAALAIPLATLVFTRLDAGLGLPWPRSAALRFALFVMVPSVAVSAPILARYG